MDEAPRCYRHPDRETYVSCSECGRPICPDCMVFAPVGIRCPDHSGQPQGPQKAVRRVQRASGAGQGGIVTRALIAVMVGIYAAQLAGGSGVNANTGWIFEKGVLIAAAIDSDGNVIGVAHGDWWRLLTAAFLHYGPIHLGMNMLALWWFGRPLEAALGRGRFIGLFVASGLAGSAGALLFKPLAPTVGASGAIFGILGAAIVLERQRTYVFGGSAMTMLVLNLAFTFAVPNISIGGHLGGLAGGMLAMLALSRLGRGHAVYGNPGLVGYASLAAIGVASVLVAYFKVRGYA